MNFLIISGLQPNGIESGSNRLRKLAKGLTSNGAKIFWTYPGLKSESENWTGIPISSEVGSKFRIIYRLICVALKWAKENPGILIVSMPPPWLIVVTTFLSLRLKARIWIDYRDPIVNQKINPRPFYFRWVIGVLERIALKFCGGVILAAPKILGHLPSAPRRFICVYGGIDPDEGDLKLNETTNTLVYGGTFYSGRSPVKFVQMLRKLSFEKKLPLDFKFKIYAKFNDHDDEIHFRKLISEPELSFIELSGLINRNDFLKELAVASFVLVITHDEGSEYAIPGKIFDYLTLKKPIIALSDDPALKEFADLFCMPVTFLTGNNSTEIEDDFLNAIRKGSVNEVDFSPLYVNQQAKNFLSALSKEKI